MVHLYALHLKSLDARAAANWYVDNLRAQLLNTTKKKDGSILVRLQLGDIPLSITQHRDAHTLPRAPEGIHLGLEHFGVVVDNLDAMLERLNRSGVPIIAPIEEGSDARWAFVRAPDGVRLELVQVDESERSKGG